MGQVESALAVAAVLLGSVIIGFVLVSALAAVVVPRATPVRLSRAVFLFWRAAFRVSATRTRSFEDRDRAMAMYAPLSLVSLPVVWLTLVALGFWLVYWGVGVRPLTDALVLSGSSLLTLGFATPPTVGTTVLSFVEAGMGIGLAALLIAYLPSMYATFSRRERMVALLEVRAGSPPSAQEMLERYHRIEWMHRLPEVWRGWEEWFVDLEESHTSLPALVFFRSPQPDRSWVTASGAVLDAAALRVSVLDLPREPEAEICIRSGYITLRRIADFFRIPYDPDPAPDDPISVARDEFDEVCASLVEAGLPVRHDRDRAWRDFAGWRVNYDVVLLALAALVEAPYAPWSSDRSTLTDHALRLRRVRDRVREH